MAAGMADKPEQKASLKERLEAFKRKATGIEKPDIGKAKGICSMAVRYQYDKMDRYKMSSPNVQKR